VRRVPHRTWCAAGVVVVVVLLVGLLGAPLTSAQTAGFSPTFAVGGLVASPRTFALADLQALPAQDVTVTFLSGTTPQTHNYRGARLFDVLNPTGPRFDSTRKNDKLRWFARVVATDGYEVAIGWGEFDPDFGNRNLLLAYAGDGQPLTRDGMARLVLPGDVKGGRYVSNVSSITVHYALAMSVLRLALLDR
jgi:DMSO/TMAO reductase YedYZ molybdopterin-dependent catalytic subunit